MKFAQKALKSSTWNIGPFKEVGYNVDGAGSNHLKCIKLVVNNGIKVPTSTGEFTGFLNHQQ